ncbi:MAG: GPW/gp25 family protein [Bacteroidota bacterium]
MATEKSFLGTGWAFPPTFIKANRQAVMLSDEDDIKNSLEVLLSTTTGERILQPNYGSNLAELVFETLDSSMVAEIADMIRNAILLHEPRVIPEDITLENTTTEGVFNINIAYTVAATNSRYNLVYPFYINEKITSIP